MARCARGTRRGAMKPMRIVTAVVLGLVLAGASGAAAQDYPVRPVTIVVPYTPGGSTEIMSRLVGQKLEEPVRSEMKPGAGTVIGASAVAKSVPNGYTLLMATPTPMEINVAI